MSTINGRSLARHAQGFKDAQFHREYKKLTGEDPDPLMPEEMEKAIREMPRDAEVIELLKKASEEGSLFLSDNCKAAH